MLSEDQGVGFQNWTNPVNEVKTTEGQEYEHRKILIYTDGSKTEHGVGAGVAIFVQQKLTVQLQFRLGTRC
jgi:secreted protein with Ig-like and vWFA domain